MFENQSEESFQVEAFCVSESYFDSEMFDGLPVWKFESLSREEIDSHYFFLAIGYRSMRSRRNLFQHLLSKGCSFINYCDRNAVLSKDLKLGLNNVFFPNVVVEPFVDIGNNNVFWTGSNICHDVKVGNHNFFASKTLIGGISSIGDLCFFGFNSVVSHGVAVASETLLGAGSLLLDNSLSNSKYLGIPAKLKDQHSLNGIEVE